MDIIITILKSLALTLIILSFILSAIKSRGYHSTKLFSYLPVLLLGGVIGTWAFAHQGGIDSITAGVMALNALMAGFVMFSRIKHAQSEMELDRKIRELDDYINTKE